MPSTRHPLRAFVTASVALVLVFLAAGVPIPLYTRYRADDGVTDSQLALATVAYLVATATALLLLGRLSDHLGRRPVAVAAVLVALAGTLVLLSVDGLPHLVIGRVLQGVACGAATGAVGSLVVDTAPRRPTWLPAVVTGTLPPAAVPVGALVSGVLADFAPHPRVLGLASVSVGLAVAAAALLWSAPTPVRRPGLRRSLVPRLVLPPSTAVVVGVAAALLATWSVGGFYQAFGPAMASHALGADGSLLVAVVFSSVVLLSPVGGLLAGRTTAVNAVRLGVILFAAGVGVAALLLTTGALVPFLAASLVAGIGNGAAASGVVRTLLAGAPPAERAGRLATSYLISYAGAALPNLVVGRLAGGTDVRVLAVAYAGLATISAVVAVVAVSRPRLPREQGS